MGVSGTDYQPTATGPNAPVGHAWDASSVKSGRPAWQAADDNSVPSWSADNGIVVSWWRYTPPVSVVFVRCSLQGGTPAYMIKNFLIQGWNGGGWDTLLTVINEPWWGLYEIRYFDFLANRTAYPEYRINISANNGGTRSIIHEVELFEYLADERVTDQLLEQGPCRYAHSVAGGGAGRVPDQLLERVSCKF